ncbi:Acetylcholinesterase collagenic tail peptide [Eumeta japonica]|uniref:Acetylcholinesterase collagenic tail peptide n=1 Tax=Eumeta variegata TaxID=151549 RepID=A0A4C1SX35_EUMVA|nr:Acetylcholinesterase collagenic tail peptide [Eumeta japonica]
MLVMGEAGVDGTPGTPGRDGSKGDKGSRGVDGQPGTPGKNGTQGEKGDIGEPGYPGQRGNDGSKGEQGEKGEPGLSGLPGTKGDKGIQGDGGTPGPPGQLGDKGEKGAVGTPGAEGDIGKTGPKGDTGSIGPTGPIGLEGTCTCPKVNTDQNNGNGNADSAAPTTYIGKAERACKFIEGADSIDEDRQLSQDGTINTAFTARCRGRKTCLKPEVEKFNITYIKRTPFMLSYRFDYRYKIEKEALLSLQSVSTSAVQHIRIKCLNAYVYSDGDDHKSRSISFVTWNDVMLRSHSTEDNPHYVYTVNKDGCKDSSRDWKVTEFALESDKPERLPVTDIYVRDVRGEKQHLFIELGELCFD